jgi:hypothetical protein
MAGKAKRPGSDALVEHVAALLEQLRCAALIHLPTRWPCSAPRAPLSSNFPGLNRSRVRAALLR